MSYWRIEKFSVRLEDRLRRDCAKWLTGLATLPNIRMKGLKIRLVQLRMLFDELLELLEINSVLVIVKAKFFEYGLRIFSDQCD